jgi:hypothetical protein
MVCSICSHPEHPEMLIDYARTFSYRRTATKFGVGYRSLHRHIKNCLRLILKDADDLIFEMRLDEVKGNLTQKFAAAMKPKRHRSILTKKVTFTWSRRAWKSS